MNNRKEKIQLLIAMTIFGTIGLVRRFIPYSSSLIVFVRGVIGVLFLLLLHHLKKEPFAQDALKEHMGILMISGIALAVNWILLFEAYRFTTISVATVCNYMAPVFVILVSPLVFKEKITLKKGICAGIAVLGMVFVSGVIETGFSGITGALLALGAAVMYAFVVVVNKKIKDVPSKDRTIFQLGFAAISVLPYLLLTEDFSTFQAETFPMLMLLLAGVLHTGIAYALYFGSIQKISAQTIALFSYIDPVVAVLLSAFVLKEGMTPLAMLGVVMVISAAVISETDFLKKKSA